MFIQPDISPAAKTSGTSSGVTSSQFGIYYTVTSEELWDQKEKLRNRTKVFSFDTNLAPVNIASTTSQYVNVDQIVDEIFDKINTERLKTDNLKKIEAFKTYGQDWNGYDADPFEAKLIERALILISSLEYQPIVVPTAQDSIQFEYHADGDYLEVEVFADTIQSYMRPKKGKSVQYMNLSFEQAKARINEFNATHRNRG